MARGVTTEWEDIQVKMGGYTALAKEKTDYEEFKETIDQIEHYDRRAELTHKQLEEEEEDDPDFAEDEVMVELKARRLAEM